MAATVQAEAMSPSQLAAEVRTGLESVVDRAALAAARRRSQRERAEILAELDRLGLTEH